MRETLYRYRYLLLGIILAAIVGQITFEYSTAKSHIDLSSGGIADWPQYGRNQEGTRYTPLNQINRDNVAYLRKAWEYHTGDFSDGRRPARDYISSHTHFGRRGSVSRHGLWPCHRAQPRDRRRDLDIRPRS